MNSKELLGLLTLEHLDNNLFHGKNQDIGAVAVFGGQVLGQALVAAGETVEGREAHSMVATCTQEGLIRMPKESDKQLWRDKLA